ncbi:MAG: hypothetical protein ABIG63_01085 [Chloroflexota bacterium]
MTPQPTVQAYIPTEDEKLSPVMIYTPQKLIWGQLISKQAIRVSTWMQTGMTPTYMSITDAQTMIFGAGQSTKTFKSSVLHIQTRQIIAYHLLPPASEAPYYDVNEPNRKMYPTTAFVGVFRFDCTIRIAQQSKLDIFLGVAKGDFLPIFDVLMSCPVMPSLKGMRAPFALVRQNAAMFTQRE